MEYDFRSIEKKWQTYWDEHKTFKVTEDPAFPREKRRYVLDMFPYPSGAGLHVGHPEGYTATDIYCLCATIYDAVCGEPPRQCVERLRGEPLVPPSIHASDLPSFVNEMLLKGLSLDPAERPQETAELLAIIDREVAFSVSPVAGTGNASVSARLLHEKRSPFGFLTSRRSFRPTVL